MEPGEGGGFKHIPFRCYQGDLPFSQCLVKPITNEGNPKTLQNLFEEVYPKISIDKCKLNGILVYLLS
jgi:Autophagy protein Apg5.